MASNEGQVETITSYSTNIIQRDPNSQSMSSVSVQYQMTDDTDKNEDYQRADRARNRKVYRIKNPFQRQTEEEARQENTGSQDNDVGASNQYAAMQYSLPPEEFLQQMRAENQYYQQQQQQQASTPAPSLAFTVTPQPQYQYSTIAASGYDASNQQNQIAQLDPKISQSQTYRTLSNSYQYNGPNSYSLESVQSTPSPLPPYVSTSLSNNQYVGTPASTYVSSSSPIYLSSPPNMQSYVSSPMSVTQTGTSDYNNKITSTVNNPFNYENNNEVNKKMQIDHYDNSANGIRYPNNVQQQYQTDYQYASSTVSPQLVSSTPDPRDSWQNAINSGSSAYSKALQESNLSQFQKYTYSRNQQENRPESGSDNFNSETHRIGNMPSANNVYLNFVQPDYQALSNLRSRTRDLETESAQPEYYSHGEYGWKLNEKRPLITQSEYATANYPRYQALTSPPESVAVSQMSFHMDTSKPHNFEQISKSSSDNNEAQEFAKAAAKAHENLKRQQQYYTNNYASNFNGNSPIGGTPSENNYYNNIEKQKNKIYLDSSSSNPFSYANLQQQDLITASPFYISSSRDNSAENKPKQPFDHDKALKAIVPIDVSNVVANSELQQKAAQGLDSGSRYNTNKEQAEHNLKQNYKSITDAFYQDKNAYYGFNIKPKPDEIVSAGSYKLVDPNAQYYVKQQSPEQYYSQNILSDNKRYTDGTTPSVSYISQPNNNYPDNLQSSANIQQQGLQRPQNSMSNDFTSILKLNDVPYRLTQNLSPETFRFNNNNYEQVGLPTPLPMRINQNLDTHQLDVASNILNKLMQNKQPGTNYNGPEIDLQSGPVSTINGFKVANPFNVDLKLVAEMLKAKSSLEDAHLIGLRDQYNKPSPPKLDIQSQLQQLLLKAESNGNLGQFSDGLGSYSSPYLDIYNNGRFPYQGIKYSRSQEEEETIVPVADASNTHPIGAVIEQDDSVNLREVSIGGELTEQDDDELTNGNHFEEERPKHSHSPGHRQKIGRYRHPNTLVPGRYPHQRKYPKTADIEEPYPLLKPPPPQKSRGRTPVNRLEQHGRRRRVKRPKSVRILKAEPLFEAENEEFEESDIPTLLRPPAHIAEAKSDVDMEPNS